MNIFIAIALFIVGLALVIYFAEKLVEGAVGTSLGFGVSAFLVSVIFIGFDPENLFVGAAGSFEQVSGIALGSIIGAAMVAMALAFGVTAVLAPMKFEKAPVQILLLPVLAVILPLLLSLDGLLSRVDGVMLLAGFAISVYYLYWLGKRGLDIKSTGEVAETLEEAGELEKWKALGLLVLSLIAIVAGSEMLVTGAKPIIGTLGLSDTVFGMTILALLVSVEELARELPAARKGRPDISYGNVVGSVLAFFLFNAGIIALVRPVPVSLEVLRFYFPLCFITVVFISLFMMTRNISRGAGVMLIILYLVFVIGGFVM